MNELYQAKYLLGLCSNDIDEETRVNFASCVDSSNQELCDNIFALVIFTVVDGIQTGVYTKESAKSYIENEFVQLGLDSACGDFSKFNKFIDLVIESCDLKCVKVQDFVDVYSLFIDVADEIGDSYKTNIYYSVLRQIVNSMHTLSNADLTRKIVTYLDGLDVSSIGSLSKVVESSLNNIRRNS